MYALALVGLVLVGLVLESGCSALAVRGPAIEPRTGGAVCEATYVVPVIDTAIAVAGTALAVWGATGDEDPEGHAVTARNYAATPGFVIAVSFGLSALYGFTKVASCQRADGRRK